MENRVHTTGERPVSPIMQDVVRLISDIRQEPTPTQEGGEVENPLCWSYVVDEVLTYPEYIKRLNDEHEETIREIDEALFEMDRGGGA